MKVTIVQINLTGGAGTDFYHVQVFGLARRLSENGCKVTVLTALSDTGNSSVRRSQDGYDVVYLPVTRRKLHQTFVSGLEQALAESEPDVVQVSELVEVTTLQTVLWCKQCRVPVAIWNGAYQFFGKGVLAQKIYLRTLGSLLCRAANGFIAKTTSAKAFLEVLGAAPGKVHAIPVGLDTEAFLRQPLETPDMSWVPQQPFLMSVGNMSRRKNQCAIIDALKLIHKEAPEFGMLLVGDGAERQNLIAQAKSLGVDDKLFLKTEPVPNPVLAEVYRKTFLTVLPSLYEIFGMAMLESLACGTPVIGRRTGGMADVLEDGVNGCLYDSSDPESIARLTLRLYRDKTAYAALRSGALESSSNYDWKAIAPRFLDVYNSIAGDKGGVG